ncbi:17271_t:CDS:1, partial [Gigaspora margarita]
FGLYYLEPKPEQDNSTTEIHSTTGQLDNKSITTIYNLLEELK